MAALRSGLSVSRPTPPAAAGGLSRKSPSTLNLESCIERKASTCRKKLLDTLQIRHFWSKFFSGLYTPHGGTELKTPQVVCSCTY